MSERAADRLQRQLDEVSTLQAIFCCEGEFRTDEYVVRQLADKLLDSPDSLQAWDPLHFTVAQEDWSCNFALPSTYPEVPPFIDFSCRGISRNQRNHVQAAIHELAAEQTEIKSQAGEEPQECVLLVLQRLQELMAERESEQQQAEQDFHPEAIGNRFSVTFLGIDHMNQSGTYMKKVGSWVQQLGITGGFVYRQSKRGGARSEDILMICESTHDATKEFLTNLRTQKMSSQDVREKKSRVLFESPEEYNTRTFTGFEFVQYQSATDLSQIWKSWVGDEEVGGLTLEKFLELHSALR